ncbi:hypothetical protein D9M68_854540 [compost metagenome]
MVVLSAVAFGAAASALPALTSGVPAFAEKEKPNIKATARERIEVFIINCFCVLKIWIKTGQLQCNGFAGEEIFFYSIYYQ